MPKTNSFLQKFMTCFIAGLTTAALLLTLGNSGTLYWFPPVVVFSLVGICLLLSILSPFIWQFNRNKQLHSENIYGFLYAVIRYTIAFDLACFGWKKIFGLQFVVPSSIADMPMNQQSGEWLTWFYFGHSHSFGIILALIQIIGSFLLLFRKTQLATAIGLFAFMLDLTLINIFYQMNAGALLQSILLTLGITFLISLEYDRLVEFFFKKNANTSSLTFINTKYKIITKISAIVLSLIFTLYLWWLKNQ